MFSIDKKKIIETLSKLAFYIVEIMVEITLSVKSQM